MVVGNAFLYQQHLCVCKKRQSLFSIIRYDNTQLWSQTRHDFAKSYCGYCWWNVWKTIPTNKNTSMEGTCMPWIIGGGARGPSPPPLLAKSCSKRSRYSNRTVTYSNILLQLNSQVSPELELVLFLVFWAEVGPLTHWPTLPPMFWIVYQWFQILPWSSHANPVKDLECLGIN